LRFGLVQHEFILLSTGSCPIWENAVTFWIVLQDKN
jgi:hypothetical protein